MGDKISKEISSFTKKHNLAKFRQAIALGIAGSALASAGTAFANNRDTLPTPTDVNAPNVYNSGLETEYDTGSLNQLVEALGVIFPNMPQERCYKLLAGYNKTLFVPESTPLYEGIGGHYEIPGVGENTMTAPNHYGYIDYPPNECATLAQTNQIVADYNKLKLSDQKDRLNPTSRRLAVWARAFFIFLHEHEHANDQDYFKNGPQSSLASNYSGSTINMSQESFADCKAASTFRWAVKLVLGNTISRRTREYLVKEAKYAEYDFNALSPRFDSCWDGHVVATGSLDPEFSWAPDQLKAWQDLAAKIYK